MWNSGSAMSKLDALANLSISNQSWVTVSTVTMAPNTSDRMTVILFSLFMFVSSPEAIFLKYPFLRWVRYMNSKKLTITKVGIPTFSWVTSCLKKTSR